MATPDRLLELQLTDTAIDQLRHRMPRLPEVVAAAAAANEVTAWERRAGELRALMGDFEKKISDAESASAVITSKRDRLEKQLKTVIVPREAEALMQEIATLNAQRSALDDDELEAMEGLSQADADLVEHEGTQARIRAAADAAQANADAARAASEADLADRLATHESLRAEIDAATLNRYDTMRGTHDGIAVAKLSGLRCDGCHLDMSRAEADAIKALPPDEMGECPNCGRLLVR